MGMIKVKPYEKLPLVYDHLMNHVNYNLWTKYIYDVSRNYVNKDAFVLEIACGNGNFSKLFRNYYPNILVTDKSLEMLYCKRSVLPKVCCDMTSLPFKTEFDLIYSTFDSVNYLTNRKDLLKLFKGTRRILSSEGIFTFDVSLEKNSVLYVANHLKKAKDKEVIYEHKSIYNKHSRIHKNIFEIRMNDGIVYKEVHKQKIYPFNVYFNLLDKAGLFVMECYEAFTFRKIDSNSKRAQFIVKRNPNALI